MCFRAELALISPSHEQLYTCLETLREAICRTRSCVEGKAGWLAYTSKSCLVILRHASTLQPQPGIPAQYASQVLIQCNTASDALESIAELNSTVGRCRMVSLLPR